MSGFLRSWEERLRRAAPDSFKSRFRQFIIDRYAMHYYNASQRTWMDSKWLGTPALKATTDLWVYQEILAEQRPDIVIETGTAAGGSALYLATICELLDHGRVLSIDIEGRDDRPRHPRLEYITASSVDPEVVTRMALLPGTKLVILDSDHSRVHVLAELDAYAPMVPVGGYLIVEDTNINGHPVLPKFGPGPWEAVHEWLPRHPEFTIDHGREKLMHTQNPDGYLRRVV